MNRRQYEILIYNDCLYRNMYRLDFHFHFLMLIKLSHRGSSTSPCWTSTRWLCPRSTPAGRPWWRRCSRLRQRTQKPSAGIFVTSTSSTGWLKIASRIRSRIWRKSLMRNSLLLFLFIPPASLNTCTWWTTCSGVQTIQKVNIVDIEWRSFSISFQERITRSLSSIPRRLWLFLTITLLLLWRVPGLRMRWWTLKQRKLILIRLTLLSATSTIIGVIASIWWRTAKGLTWGTPSRTPRSGLGKIQWSGRVPMCFTN